MHTSANFNDGLVVVCNADNSWQRDMCRNGRADTGGTSSSDLTLLEKLRSSYYGRYNDPHVTEMSDRAGTAFFWYIALSELYILVVHVIPYWMADWSDTARYYAKVVCWFGFIQVTANWACIRYVRTDYYLTDDRPDKNQDVQYL